MSEIYKKSSIYTRTGDTGMTSLFNGERVFKSNLRIETLGKLDTFNSYLGLCYALYPHQNEERDILVELMSRIFDISSNIATPYNSSDSKLRRVALDSNCVIKLEEYINKIDSNLPQLTNFILPTGNELSASLHIARSLCREAERVIISLFTELNRQEELILPESVSKKLILSYMNRMSDLLFCLARKACIDSGNEEIIYKKD